MDISSSFVIQHSSFRRRRWRPFSWLGGLNVQIAAPFLIFVVVGSVGLAWWLQGNFARGNRELFATLARTNADFIRDSRLARSRQTATDLGRVLAMQVFFRSTGGEWTPAPGAGPDAATLRGLTPRQGPVSLGTRKEAIAVNLDADADLVFVRATPARTWRVLRPATVAVFVVFWGLTLALAFTLSRRVARPLRLLAARLPHIAEKTGDATLPGADRRDEIGLLARAYLATHAQLTAERAARAQAERLALLGRMTTGLAHEIHNPLAGIRLHLQLLASARADGLRDAVAESVPVVLGETAKIESLVNQWMFLVRPEPPQTSPVALAALVENATRPLLPLAAHARVSMDADVPADLHVRADARRLGQAVGNVVLNAIQAMPGGGTLRIRARADGPDAVLTFHDTGQGFSEEALARHAELFYSEKEGGMGIGLSVATEVVRAHDGTLRVGHGEPGAVVTITLPLVAP